MHPSPGWTGPTVVGHLAGAGFRIATSGASERQGIVQRLDVGTSGVMVICKSEHAYSRLKNAFRHREVDKTYHALVQGHPDPLEGTIDAPIGRHPKSDWKFAVMADGRPSVTHYSTLEAHRFASLLEVHLETGRTHQIRVHMAALKHPCVGDHLYGADPTLAARVGLDRQWLHAVRARLRAPRVGGLRRVRVDLPRRPGPRARGHPRCRTDGSTAARPAAPEDVDADRRASTWRSRGAAAMPPGIHPEHEVRAWLTERLADDEVWVAEVDGDVAAYARFTATWLDDLYVAPDRAGQGLGSALLDLVKAQRPGGFCLWVFEMNAPGPRLLRPPRPGRARAHRRLRQRGEAARHQDGLAGDRPARASTAASSTRSTPTWATCWPAAPPSPAPSSRTSRPPSATRTASARSPRRWPSGPGARRRPAAPDRARDHHREPGRRRQPTERSPAPRRQVDRPEPDAAVRLSPRRWAMLSMATVTASTERRVSGRRVIVDAVGVADAEPPRGDLGDLAARLRRPRPRGRRRRPATLATPGRLAGRRSPPFTQRGR